MWYYENDHAVIGSTNATSLEVCNVREEQGEAGFR